MLNRSEGGVRMGMRMEVMGEGEGGVGKGWGYERNEGGGLSGKG